MRIRWTPAAVSDLRNIRDYLNENYPHFTRSTVQRLYDTVRSLKQWPHRGRTGREAGTRELVLSSLPYILVYRVKEQNVEVPRIYHAAQDKP